MCVWSDVRKVLGFYGITAQVKANPDKVRAIMEMAPSKNIKEVQSLNSRVMALNRFAFKAIKKCLPFFKELRKAFECTDEC